MQHFTLNIVKTATNPSSEFTWISASAGTGKTRILTHRILRLLIAGKTKILCLTFTNAAAYEIKERVYKTAIKWMSMSQQELSLALKEICHDDLDKQRYKDAQKLFFNIHSLLTIQTIHSFCYNLISAFPTETGISQNYTIKDISESYPKIFKKLFLEQNIKHHFEAISTELTESIIYNLLYKIISKKFNKNYIYKKYKNTILNTNFNSTAYTLINILQNGSTRDKKISYQLSEWYNLSQSDKLTKIKDYAKIFINLSNFERKPLSSIITKNTLEQFPEAENIIINEQENIAKFIEQFDNYQIIHRTYHLIKIAEQFTNIYTKDKQRNRYLDHNDIIHLTLNLMTNIYYKDWILFQLDQKINHILIDEAQDNSLEQWEIITQLCNEFFSGTGTTNEKRSLFVVGDIKQSIYSFQNARPDYFYPMCQYFANKSTNPTIIKLNTSFRSAQPILTLVDKIFNNFQEQISFEKRKIEHIAYRKNDYGYVEVWPLPIIDIQAKKDAWNQLHIQSNNHTQQLASTIAHKIHSWITMKRTLISKHRPITAGDILVLVRHRNTFIDYLTEELRKFNIPVSGRDKFNIMDHIVIKDLVNLGEFLLLQKNDMSLANLLKSPIFKFTEEQLFNLSYPKNHKHLWDALQLNFTEISNYLKQLINISKHYSPLDLYHYILSKHKQQFIKCMGTSVTEVIDEFINLLIKFETNNLSSLESFIHWIKHTNPEVKRDLSNINNSISIMTVHNAKGMQFPIVFLTDTTSIPRSDSQIIFDEQNTPFWCRNNVNNKLTILKNKRNLEEYNEYIRLLYVALTRAEDELYITGENHPHDKSWYNIISNISDIYTKKSIELPPMFTSKVNVLCIEHN
ncbi:UvrD-helicase domain-containing protein [Candidatus Neoehrlichia procyonis]|uniref:DNA 3'-5' helicase n=1 Tax=Candidatus Neoehrlichia procyonis str. RAC413 TaxID=1359163 RepID=A0A0F3NM04_9RICK|nr:UvrD-helicase domain-containing protein [Candidatus Neoehrlichia lotoris]KJV69078.1 uvrD/REP helicase N-terminal domain protein [Candidatus Neoehrlichia lotoris str. RAC413]